MPNCDFYALRDDARLVLEFVFEETDCQVFEMTSAQRQPLREFRAPGQVMDAFGKFGINLQLYAPSMKGKLRTKRVELDTAKDGEANWLFEIHGWGAIQLYLATIRNGRIENSHTNHNSEKRALKWESIYGDDLGPVAAWDWKRVAAISRRINSRIRKLAPAKRGSRPILPAAHQALQTGEVGLA